MANGTSYLDVSDSLADAFDALLRRRGIEDHDGLADTPVRMAHAWIELTKGYEDDPAAILATQFDASQYDQLVSLRDIEFVSLCEHHLMPFSGTVDICYLPGDRVVGLSKLARLVDCYARRLQIQERLTMEIAHAIEEHLHARGVGVIVHGTHACMTARGVHKPGAVMVTSEMLGVLRESGDARAEALRLMGR